MDATVNAFFLAQLEKLRLLRKTARGEVWLALLAPSRPVVWKHIRAAGLPYTLLAKCQPHPLWPEILFCAEDEAETTIVEEYVQGEPLSARLAEKRFLSESEAASVLLQMADGLSVLHEMGIVHRDIKPSNLILSESGIRLIDFDVARTIKEEKQEDTALLGTKGYAPPEQFGYGQTDARSDIYALGVTLRKLVGPEYHGWLSPILGKCTELDPKRRYASAVELKRAVQMRRRWAKAKTGCAALLAALVVAALYFSPASSVPPATREAASAPEERSVSSAPNSKENTSPPTEETAPPTETQTAETETEVAAHVPDAPETNTDAQEHAVPPQPPTPQRERTADEEAEAFLALFADNPEKFAYWQIRKEGYFHEIEDRHLPPAETEEAKREAVGIMRRGELGLRAEAFEKTLPKTMTRDEKNRAYHEFVSEQVEILGITDW